MWALTPQRLCLGVVRMDLWARDDETFRQAKDRKYEPIEEKESFRWLEGYRLACDLAEELPQTQIVSIADREADIYECFLKHSSLAHPGVRNGSSAPGKPLFA